MAEHASGVGPAQVEALRAAQSALAAQVSVRDGYPRPLRTVAGFDVGFDAGARGIAVRAAATLLEAATLRPIASGSACLPSDVAYVPGLLSFRVLPALMAALGQLPQAPDLALVDAHGIAHPHRLGLAAHFGVAAGLPVIGVAGRLLVGSGRTPHEVRGAYTPLRLHGTQLGWLLRSRVGDEPLVVSPGHRVSMASAADLVMRFVGGHRLPEPLRLARGLLAGAATPSGPVRPGSAVHPPARPGS